jgi:hypothetical protein
MYSNLIKKYQWLTVFIVLDKNSPPIYTIVALGIAERIRLTTSAGRWLHELHQMTSNGNTTFADVLVKFRNTSRGTDDEIEKLLS